jgi:hypothetical protein
MIETIAALFYLVVVVLAAFGGAYFIARSLAGAMALLGWLAWLCAPLAFLALAFASETDPTLTAERASYNFWMALVLTSVAVMVVWLPASIVGAARGKRARLRRAASAGPSAAPAPSAAGPVATTRDDGLPFWSVADSPRLTEAELQAKLAELARRGGIDPAHLPHFGSSGPEGEFVLLDKFDYLYFGREHGGTLFEHATVVADHLCYLVLRDRARALAADRIAGTPAEPYAARLAAEQQAILAAIDPRWGAQLAHEQQAAQP